MPARLHFSNSLDALAERLMGALRGGDPLQAPCIALPSPAMRGWLQTRLAERLGIAANLDFQTLENLLWDLLAERDVLREAPDRQPARLLDPLNFQGMVMSRIRNDPPEALKAYLNPAGEEPHDRARRLCQLSGRLASLFREYEYSRVGEGGRRGVSEAWNRNEPCFAPTWKGLELRAGRLRQGLDWERWQAEIYRNLFGEGGWRDRWGAVTGLYRYTLPQYAAMVLDQKDQTPKARADAIHLFGLSHISPFHRALIHRLAETGVPIEIYAFNPCAEYWEDAFAPRKRGKGRGERKGWITAAREDRAAPLTETELQVGDLPDGGENDLLARFGKPGRETVTLWNQVTDYDFSGCFLEPEGNGLLAAVQRSLLNRTGALPEAERRQQDPSLQIWSAPDLYAEAEGVRAHIAARLLADPGLRPEDIAVIPAACDAYLPALEAVFAETGRDAGHVPSVFLESGAREGGVLKGLRMLLDLGEGPLRPAALLAFLENPSVQRKLGLNSKTLEEWEALLSSSGFQEGWDADHLQAMEAPAGHSHWEAARGRLLSGRIFDASDPALAAAGWFPAATEADRGAVADLLDRMQILRGHLQPLWAGTPLPFGAWSRWLLELLNSTFAANPDDPADAQGETQLRRFCVDLESWGQLDSVPVGHHLISVLLDDHFRDPRSRSGSFLQGGVRIGSLAALRGLPFRHVYVLGLSAGDFPSARAAAPLDLRGLRRILGEADPAARDLYGFLETLATARDSAVLSYVRRDPKRDSLRQPSFALTSLAAFLERDLLPAAADGPGRFLFLELDEDGRYAPQAENSECWDVSPPRHIRQLRFRAAGSIAGIRIVELAAKKWAQPPPLPAAAALPENRRRIRLSDLCAFLKNPAEYACLRRFDLFGTLETEEEEDSPPLEFGKYASRDLMADALASELIRPGSWETRLREELALRSGQGLGPPPPFSGVEIGRLEELGRARLQKNAPWLRRWMENKGLRFAGSLRIGPSSTPTDPPLTAIPSFDLAALGADAEITGNLPFFLTGTKPENGWGLLWPGTHEPLAAYVYHLCSAGLGGEDSAPGFLFICPMDGEKKTWKAYRLPRLGRGAALSDLRVLWEDFGRTGGPEHLPLDVIVKIGPDEDGVEGPGWKRKIEDRERDEEETNRRSPGRKQRIVTAIEPPVPDDADVQILRRIEPYLAWKKAWGDLDEAEEET